MLLSTMYHHINCDQFSNDLENFEQHLKYVVDRFHIVVPGDTLPKKRDNLCLTFDDAYYDFYYYVFPLLKKYQVKAVLAVPTALISDSTDITPDLRMSLGHKEIYQEKNYQKYGSFCTWDELREMQDSGFVVMASHSHTHKDLTGDNIDLQEEIITSLTETRNCSNRSEAVSLLLSEGITSKQAVIRKIVEAYREIERLRREAQKIGTSANPSKSIADAAVNEVLKKYR